MLYATQMKNHHADFSIKFENSVVAFLLAVSCAAFVYVFLHTSFEIVSIISGGGFEYATSYAHHSWMLHFSLMKLVTFVAGWMFVFFITLIPYAAGIIFARYFKISHQLYFVGGSVLTAAVICAVYAAIPNLGINIHETGLSFGQKYWGDLPVFLICAAMAGWLCWRYYFRGANNLEPNNMLAMN